MDNSKNPQNQFEPVDPIQKKPLMLVEVGLFEVFFVVLLLAVLLTTLNYFGLISLARFLPALSILPTKNVIHSTVGTNTIPSKPPSQNPKDYKNNDSFSYSLPIAKILIQNNLQDVLQPQFVPQNVSIEQDFLLDKTKTTITQADTFSGEWNENTDSFYTSIEYAKGTNKPHKFIVFVDKPMLSTTITPMVAANLQLEINSVFTKLAKNPTTPLSCTVSSKTFYYCDESIKANGEKYYFGSYTWPYAKNNNYIHLFGCSLYEGTSRNNDKCINVGP